MRRIRGSGKGPGDFVSVSWEGPTPEEMMAQVDDEVRRATAIASAEQAAAEREMGDAWTIDLTVNVNDGSTIKATVVKAADGEPTITAWDPNAQRDAAESEGEASDDE